MLRFSHCDTILRAAINGQGVALGRMSSIVFTLVSGAQVAPLNQPRFKADLGERAYWLIASPASRERPQVRSFLQWLMARIKPLASWARSRGGLPDLLRELQQHFVITLRRHEGDP